MNSGIWVEYAGLVCQQVNAAEVCGLQTHPLADGRVRLRTQIRSNCWICGMTVNRFFLFRGRGVAITMNSIKILHAVRSAITAKLNFLLKNLLFWSHFPTLVLDAITGYNADRVRKLGLQFYPSLVHKSTGLHFTSGGPVPNVDHHAVLNLGYVEFDLRAISLINLSKLFESFVCSYCRVYGSLDCNRK